MVLRNSGRVGSRRLEKGESRKREESVERLAPFFGIYTSRCRDVARYGFLFFITLVFIPPFLADTNLIIPIKKVNIY